MQFYSGPLMHLLSGVDSHAIFQRNPGNTNRAGISALVIDQSYPK
jgi:hypothetical protein